MTHIEGDIKGDSPQSVTVEVEMTPDLQEAIRVSELKNKGLITSEQAGKMMGDFYRKHSELRKDF